MQMTHRPSPTQAIGLRARGKAPFMIQQAKKQNNNGVSNHENSKNKQSTTKFHVPTNEIIYQIKNQSCPVSAFGSESHWFSRGVGLVSSGWFSLSNGFNIGTFYHSVSEKVVLTRKHANSAIRIVVVWEINNAGCFRAVTRQTDLKPGALLQL